MANLPTDWPIEEYKDIMSQQFYFESVVFHPCTTSVVSHPPFQNKTKLKTLDRKLTARKAKYGTDDPDMTDVWDGLRRKARDHARNPMQWDNSHDAGFSLGNKDAEKPWMRLHDDYKEWNVATQREDEGSVLSFWKRMLVFRKKHLSCVGLIRTFASPLDLFSRVLSKLIRDRSRHTGSTPFLRQRTSGSTLTLKSITKRERSSCSISRKKLRHTSYRPRFDRLGR